MCAATRLSFGSTDCEPVKSIPVTVAVNVIDVIASLMKKLAKPNDVLGTPDEVVGLVGGFSWALVRVAVKITPAYPLPANMSVRTAGKVVCSRSMNYPSVATRRERRKNHIRRCAGGAKRNCFFP